MNLVKPYIFKNLLHLTAKIVMIDRRNYTVVWYSLNIPENFIFRSDLYLPGIGKGRQKSPLGY
jgi:hypothetical protein